MKIAAQMVALIVEIQEEANRIAEASRTDTPEGKSSPNLDLERLIQQAQADAEIAGYCTTDKSRKDRRAALVRAGACTLLALFEMDREESLFDVVLGDGTAIPEREWHRREDAREARRTVMGGIDPKQEGDRLVVVDGLYRAAIGEDEGGSYG